MRKKNRLSHVEVVTMAIVFGLVATTVVPKFVEASGESETGELIDGLQGMRAQLCLYRVQHEDSLPPTGSLESFKTAMTTEVGQRGPYVEKIPVNPCNGLNTVRFDGEPAGAGKAGWRLDTKTGSFQADNDAAYAAF